MLSLYNSVRGAAARRAAACAGVLALALAAACSEELESGAACPSLCPVTNAAVRDTVLTPVVLDSALGNVPIAGDAGALLLALRPGADSLDVRAVFRFDSLPARYAPPAGGDSVPIGAVQGSALRLRVDTATATFGAGRARVPASPVTLEAYDVDTAVGADTTAAALVPLFRPGRLLGSVTLPAGAALPDSAVRIPLSDAAVAARAGGRLRVGVRVVSADRAQLRVFSASAAVGSAPTLRFDPSPDATANEVTVASASGTPSEVAVARAYRSQSVVARAAQQAPGADLVVGGLPAGRSFLRFAVPARFVDSVNLVRATLELTQRPAAGGEALDSVSVVPLAVFATGEITDLTRASELSVPVSAAVRLGPAGEGLREFAVILLLGAWRALPAGTQRAVVLRAESEGVQASQVRFYSMEAPAGLRPRLRLSYIPNTTFGLP
jgi:hypothetical protein